MRNVFFTACLLCMQQLSAQTSLTVTSAVNSTSVRPAVNAGTISGEIRGLSSVGPNMDDGFLRLSAGGGTTANAKTYIDLSGYTYQLPERFQNIVLGTSGAERMRIDYNGNIGIGTSSPTSRLNLDFGSTRNNITMTSDGNAAAYSDFCFAVKTQENIPANNVLSWVISHRKEGLFSGSAPSSLEFYGVVQGGGYYVPLTFKTDGDIVLASSLNAKRSGNVGIGTITPSAKLHIEQSSGSSNIEQTAMTISRNGNSYGLYSFVTNYDNTDLSKIYLSLRTGGVSNAITVNNNTGNIGINTIDTKGYKLAVNGSAIFTKAVVKNYASWPDYVFDSAYQLPSLETVSSFIKENKHLPEIPSASVIEKDGHDLGALQTLLLKKVEELTLYVIEQNAVVANMKKDNEELKRENKKIRIELEELKARKK